jgi:hypothetical protein
MHVFKNIRVGMCENGTSVTPEVLLFFVNAGCVAAAAAGVEGSGPKWYDPLLVIIWRLHAETQRLRWQL